MFPQSTQRNKSERPEYNEKNKQRNWIEEKYLIRKKKLFRFEK